MIKIKSTKLCSKCKFRKPISNFTKSGSSKDGLHCWCRSCRKQYRSDRRRSHGPGYDRDHDLRRNYGISLDEYNELFGAQEGKCAICKVEAASKLNVDHCHETGKVRGLLCTRCNNGLAFFKDDYELLTVALEYLGR